MTNQNTEVVGLYLNYYFSDTYSLAEHTINEFQGSLKPDAYPNLSSRLFSNTIILKALFNSKEKYEPSSILTCVKQSFVDHQSNKNEKNRNKDRTHNDNKIKRPFPLEEVSTSESDIKEQLVYHLSILQFYADHDFLPWWSEEKSLSPVFKSLEKQRTSATHLFEEVILAKESEEEFLGKLATVLPTEYLDTIIRILAPYERLRGKWEESLSKYNEARQPYALGQKLVPNSDSALDKALDSMKWKNQDFHLLKKSLYFLEDKEIMETAAFNKEILKGQMEIYIKLAPHFYFQNITPQKWRQYIYIFLCHNLW